MSFEQVHSTRPRHARLWALLAACALVLVVVGARSAAGWLDERPGPEPAAPTAAAAVSAEDPAKLEAFVLSVVKDADALWAAELRRRGKPYTRARPTLLETPQAGACGPGMELGRGDCYGDERVFVDLSFQRGLGARLGEAAAGARAYALAHEVGHHVQRVLGLDRKLDELLVTRRVASHWAAVQLELQADCLAGVWSRRSRLAPWADGKQIEASLRHASELGTERRLAAERDPNGAGETFTYAIPRRRIYWFAQGYERGELDDCDTFAP